MKIQLLRNATMKLEYAGKTFLTDPMLGKKGSIRSFAGIEKNPIVNLTVDIDKILEEIDAVLVTHMHPDHFDDTSSEMIDKNTLVFIQNSEEEKLRNQKFTNVIAIEDSVEWKGITITRVRGAHGSGAILERMGDVSGYVLQAENQPTVYWIGDSILCNVVIETIEKYQPDLIITHSGGAIIPGFEKILMDAEETIRVAKASPTSKVIAIHMEALDHCTVSRKIMRDAASEAGISEEQLIIPADGEVLEL